MLKKLMLAVVPMLMVATNEFAADDVISDVANLKADSISDASISIEAGIGALDVDALAKDAGKDKSTEAIEACFRGYGYGGYGYGCGYGYGGYGYGYGSYGCYGGYGGYYNSCYNSCYSSCYSYYPSYSYCYRPVCYSTCYSPCYTSYWGCY
jgi:hypothetical protein